jgi:hypothetical protein
MHACPEPNNAIFENGMTLREWCETADCGMGKTTVRYEPIPNSVWHRVISLRPKRGRFAMVVGKVIRCTRIQEPNNAISENGISLWKWRETADCGRGKTTVKYEPIPHAVWHRVISLRPKGLIVAQPNGKRSDACLSRAK